MKELSIFVDEAGVLGPFKKNDPYYVLSFVFHNQEQDINEELLHLEENFTNLGFKAQSFHAGPIIRREEEYRVVDREVRKKLFMAMISFVRRAPIQCKSIYVEKKHLEDDIELVGRLSIELQRFLLEHLEYFLNYDVVKVYYDNGQIPIGGMISSVFMTTLSNVKLKKVIPSDYRLFQVSDLLCTLKLIELKLERKCLSKSELAFFNYSDKTLKKQYLKIIKNKILV